MTTLEKKGAFQRHKTVTIISGILVILLIASILLELTLKYFVGLGNPILYYSYPLYGYRPVPNQDVTRFHGSEIRINNLGLRADSDWDNDKKNKILFLGDSVTYGGSYVSNDELFTSLALNNVNGFIGGNAAVNGWGVENIYGLIVQSGFLPSDIYLTVVIENDFYRGVTRLEGQPYWCRKPRFAIEELLHFIFYKLDTGQYINWEQRADENEKMKVVDAAANKLHEMDSFLRSQGYKHLIFISPTRAQVVYGADKDEMVEEYLKKYDIKAVYISGLINGLDNVDKDRLFNDYFHLSKYGHKIWGELIGKEISRIVNN